MEDICSRMLDSDPGTVYHSNCMNFADTKAFKCQLRPFFLVGLWLEFISHSFLHFYGTFFYGVFLYF